MCEVSSPCIFTSSLFLKKGNESTIYKQNKNGQTELKNSLLHCFDSVKMVKKNKLQLARSDISPGLCLPSHLIFLDPCPLVITEVNLRESQ